MSVSSVVSPAALRLASVFEWPVAVIIVGGVLVFFPVGTVASRSAGAVPLFSLSL